VGERLWKVPETKDKVPEVDMIISGPTVVCPSERHGVHGNLVTILLE
jgi:hypothetical protein